MNFKKEIVSQETVFLWAVICAILGTFLEVIFSFISQKVYGCHLPFAVSSAASIPCWAKIPTWFMWLPIAAAVVIGTALTFYLVRKK